MVVECVSQNVTEIVLNKMVQIESLENHLKTDVLLKFDQIELNELKFYCLAECKNDFEEKVQGVLKIYLVLSNINIEAYFRIGKSPIKSTNKP